MLKFTETAFVINALSATGIPFESEATSLRFVPTASPTFVGNVGGVCKRSTDSELAGNVYKKLVPAFVSTVVTGKTFVGLASEFSFSALEEVSCIRFAADPIVASPFTLNNASIGPDVTLTA